MRYLLSMMAVMSAALLVTGGASAADEVTYVSKDQVSAALSKGAPLTEGSNYKVSMSRRTGPGEAELHADETDIFYIVEGSATFVTGGTVTDEKTTGPGQIRGSGIQGGKTQALSKGDVIVIPKGVPHWFKAVPGLVVYYVVKVI